MKNTKKMEKMLKKMNLDRRIKKGGKDSSDSDSSENEEAAMDIDMTATKQIQKKKPLPRSYYQALKKSIRRKIKDGNLPDIAKLDAMLAD